MAAYVFSTSYYYSRWWIKAIFLATFELSFKCKIITCYPTSVHVIPIDYVD